MQSANLLLASLSASDAAAIVPHLRSVQLEHQSILFGAGDPINAVYFPTGAIISLVVGLSTGEMVEAAMVGKDGAVGAASALDGKVSLNRAIVQISGKSLVCDVDALKGAALQSHSLLSKIIRHEQTVFAQAQQSTACMATHDVEARLCRWLLRARDLSGSERCCSPRNFLPKCSG
jgi:CRP-like cAMP-binding protein